MSDKERLEEIKDRISKLFGYETAKDDDMYYMKKKHINWLIKQAEKAEKLQQENEKEQKRLKNQIYKISEEKFLLEKQLQQAQAKAERYRHTLEHFANLGTNHDTNPTLVMDGNEVFMLLDYIKSMDKYVRCEARKALECEENA